MDDSKHHVSVAKVIDRYGASLQKAQRLLESLLEAEDAVRDVSCSKALKEAILTPDNAITKSKREMLNVLRS
jgi:hypothetical protein